MQIDTTAYAGVLFCLALSGALLVIQLVVADLVGIFSGHIAGYPITPDHRRFLFRSARAHANTNESIYAFGMLTGVGVVVSVEPYWLTILAGVWLISRVLHMLAYYASIKRLRSIFFAISLVSISVILVLDLVALYRLPR